MTTDYVVDTDLDQLKALNDKIVELQAEVHSVRVEMGKVLERMRTHRGLSFRQAGKLLDCDPSNLKKIEMGTATSGPVIERALKEYPAYPLLPSFKGV